MIWISHPTGNSFVRALLAGLERGGAEHAFYTTIVYDAAKGWTSWLPAGLRQEFQRRSFPVPRPRVRCRPGRELGRWLCARLGLKAAVAHETGVFSVDAVYRDLDCWVAREMRRAVGEAAPRAVHAYEDGALATFAAAREQGVHCSYDLPIAYWESARRLLQEEAARWPQWEPTLLATRDSAAKLERKAQELALADVVVCPSQFVFRTLPETVRLGKRCVVAEFGSPPIAEVAALNREESDERSGSRPPAHASRGERPLRVLFAGSMTQRKGLADVFAAMRLLRRADVQLVVMGTPLLPLAFYRRQWPHFVYEPPRPRAAVLRLMQQCDVLVLPSIVEGRALVQQEALSCGLPLIVTPNAGGEDLVDAGLTGFLVPIRSPSAVADAIAWFADHREALPAMREQARRKATQYTWEGYATKILAHLQPATAESHPASKHA